MTASQTLVKTVEERSVSVIPWIVVGIFVAAVFLVWFLIERRK